MTILIKEKRELLKIQLMEYVVRIKLVNDKETCLYQIEIVKILTKETRLKTIMIILIKKKRELMKMQLMEHVVRIKIVNTREI